MKVLLIGCGLTSTITAYFLRIRVPNVHLTVWDKAKGPGGRTSVRRGPNGAFVDLGAQFVTADPSALTEHSEIYERLLSAGTLVPMKCKIDGLSGSNGDRHFVAPDGANSLVKHFLREARVDCTEFERRVCSVEATGRVTSERGSAESFDLIIITAPAPQILQLDCPIPDGIRGELEKVAYSTRFTFNAFYEKPVLPVEWDAKFMDDDTFRYVSVDNRKRGKRDTADCVIFHTTKEFGRKNVQETRESVLPMLRDKMRELFPDWPSPESYNAHKWLYSQVTTPYHDNPGCVVLNRSVPIIAGGDGFTRSTFNGCIESAIEICHTVDKLRT